MLRQATGLISGAAPKKMSLSRNFVSSMASINGQTSRIGGRSEADQRSHIRNSNTSNKKLVGEEHGAHQILSTDVRLKDLRQQIAAQEKKLKLKSPHQNKDNVSISSRNYNASDSEIDAPRKSRMVSADFAKFEVEEPDRKRLKLSEPPCNQHISEVQQHMLPVEPSIPLGQPVLVNIDKESTFTHRHREKRTNQVSVQSGSAQQEKQEDTLGIMSSGNGFTNAGADIIIDGNPHCMNKRVDPFISSGQPQRVANTSKPLSKELSTVELNPVFRGKQNADRATCGRNIANSAELHEHRYKEKALEPVVIRTHQMCSVNVQKSNLGAFDAFSNDVSIHNCLDNMGIPYDNNMDMETLFGIEELQDKELEAAQENRRKCEIEERNAFRAYRKAQRVLVEANARCSHLYRRRELCSVHFQTLMMENPSLLRSSRQQAGINSLNYEREDDVHELPASSHQVLDAFNVHNGQDRLYNIQTTDDASRSQQEKLAAGQHVAFKTCSEQDGSVSVLQKDIRVADGGYINTSSNEDKETFPCNDKSDHSNLDCQIKEGSFRERPNITADDLTSRYSFDTSQDSLTLEATLRSQLFARLGTKTLSKNTSPTQSVEPASVASIGHGGVECQAETAIGNLSIALMEKNQYSASAGNDGVEKNASQFSVHINSNGHFENFSSNCASPVVDALDSCLSSDGDQTSRSVSLSHPILRSTFSHLKLVEPICILAVKSRNLQFKACDIYNDESNSVGSAEIPPISLGLTSIDDTPMGWTQMNICSEKVGSYTCNVGIDPLWPLCLFELREKCNDDKCSWQHSKDYSFGNKKFEEHENPGRDTQKT